MVPHCQVSLPSIKQIYCKFVLFKNEAKEEVKEEEIKEEEVKEVTDQVETFQNNSKKMT